MFFVAVLSTLAVAGAVSFYALILAFSHKPRPETASEQTYVSAANPTEPRPLPNLADAASLQISVVVPCYNEAARLRGMLDEAVPYLRTAYGQSWEILLVDDGSRDDTVQVALAYARDARLDGERLRVASLVRNRGKGGAVTHGIRHARGQRVLFADADGASSFGDLAKLEAAVAGEPRAVAIGSRAHMVKTEAVVRRTFIRNFLMYGLHTLLYVFGIRAIRDTQCGFKLFTRPAAQEIFPHMHTERWIFDVEALLLAMRRGIPVHEIAISWHEVEGSKIDLARDSVLMAVDLMVIRFAYLLGIYKDH